MDAAAILARLAQANAPFEAAFPGGLRGWQPVHTCYVGAQHARADLARRWGDEALAALDRHAPEPEVLGEVLGLPRDRWEDAHRRTRARLEQQPVQDLRLDFEDGYGTHPDAVEDGAAATAAAAVARAHAAGGLPPAWGLRIKPFTLDHAARGARTLERFLAAVLDAAGALPPGFRLTLPKVSIPEQVQAGVQLLELLEARHGLAPGSLPLEIMVETPQALVGADGRVPLPALLQAGGPRLLAVHLGTYDLTASHGVPARYQALDHPTCDFAKHLLRAAVSGTGVQLCDGSTNVLPVGDRAAVHAAWRLQAGHLRHSLRGGWTQGWDLHPAQLVVRWAVNIAFYADGLDAVLARLQAMQGRAGAADDAAVQDDAATVKALWQTVRGAVGCGALAPAELAARGLRDPLEP